MKFLLLLLFSYPSISLSALRVTIDPGHGGAEQGAVHSGIVESQIALDISKELHSLLLKDADFLSQLIRQSDKDLELEDRVRLSKRFNTDLFISIHANANPNPSAQGTEFYIQNQLPVEEETLFLAHTEHSGKNDIESKPRGDVEAILYDLEKSHRILKSFQVSSYLQNKWPRTRKRRIRQGPFYVLSHNDVPAVLVEVGYLTNPKERAKLTQKAYQREMAKKIHMALKDYAKSMDKLPLGILKPRDAKTR